MNLFVGIFIPFAGTVAGAACVFILRKKQLSDKLQKCLLGFAAGVMLAASIWSLLLPALDRAAALGKWSFIPAVIGFLLGIFLLLGIHRCVPIREQEMPAFISPKTWMMLFAVTLHNIPEGMAVGVAFAGALSGNELLSFAGAFSLAIGIAIQNFPEGAIVSLPLAGGGISKRNAFLAGTLSGIVEPIAAGLTIVLATFIRSLLPYFLSFAAGAMIYVVMKELVPEFVNDDLESDWGMEYGILFFAIGFVIMMTMDVVFG